jgi:glucosamine--fructose-6-phosphate aminotransferase (isomerizing)
LHAGIESTVACKSYVTSLVVLHWLTALLCREDLSEASREIETAEQGVERYLGHWRLHVDQWIDLTNEVQCLFVTGRGASLATTGTAGLILKESTRRPAEGMSSAAFRHGPLEVIGPHVLVLVLAGEARVNAQNRRLYEDILGGGGRAVWLAPHATSSGALDLPEVCSSLLPMVEILPVQMLSLALAARDGREAGRFEKASKVTLVA